MSCLHYFSFRSFGTYGRHIFSGHPHNTNTQENISSSNVTAIPTAPTVPTTTSTASTTIFPVPTVPLTTTGGSLTYPPPPHPSAGSPFSQGTKLCNSCQVPPGNLHHSCGGGMYQTPLQGGKGAQSRILLLTQEKLPPPKLNITLEEQKAIKEPKEDLSWVVMTADKGLAMVVMEWEDYMDKAQLLLADTNTYKAITKDPTNKLKNKLTKILRDIKTRKDSMKTFTRKVYPTSMVVPKFYGLPKIHKIGTPSGPLSPGGVHHKWSG